MPRGLGGLGSHTPPTALRFFARRVTARPRQDNLMGLFRKKKPDQPARSPDATPTGSAPIPEPKPTTPATTPATPPVKAAASSAPAPTPAAAPAGGQAEAAPFVEATDAFGRRVRLSRDEYRTKVLPDLVKQHGNDPDRLTAVILQAVRDGCAGDMVAAANRLTVIDKDPERALSVLGVVQRDSGDLDGAQATLQELLQKRPQSPSARVGMALLADQRGNTARAETLLHEALAIDPNHADAVHALLQIRHRHGGDTAYREELEKLVLLPDTWRPQLWLARWHLQHDGKDQAVAIYRDVLVRAGDQSDTLVMAANDLVQAQQHELVGELIAKRFQAGRHHPHAGLALLHHYVQTKDEGAGSELLHQMFLHYGHVIGDQLQPFTAEFDRQRLAKLPPPAPLPANPRIGLYRFDRPSWFAGYEDPQWLLPKKDATARQVMIMALAVDGTPQLPPGREDELGRLTRGLPLWLAEQIWLGTPHRGMAALPLAEQGGWAVMGRPWPEDQLIQQLPEAERAATILVTGVLRVEGEKRRIDLWAYDGATSQRIGHAAAEGTAAEIGRMMLQLMAELWPALGGPSGHKPPVGDEAFWHRYMEGLAQHAALVVTLAGGMPKDRLYGERYVAQWLQHAALQETRWQPGFWLYGSSLCVLHQLGSKVPKEHARMVAEIFRQSPPNSPFARLAMRPLRAVGLDAHWQARRAEIVGAAGNDPVYVGWLQRAEAAK